MAYRSTVCECCNQRYLKWTDTYHDCPYCGEELVDTKSKSPSCESCDIYLWVQARSEPVVCCSHCNDVIGNEDGSCPIDTWRGSWHVMRCKCYDYFGDKTMEIELYGDPYLHHRVPKG